MGDDSSSKKMKIIPGKQDGDSFKDLGSAIEVCFNPSEFSIDEGNDFAEAGIPGLSAPIIQFKQGKARTLSLTLMLDTYFSEDAKKDDLRTKYIKPLEKMINLDSDLHAPPLCRVVWGTMDFIGVLKSLKKNYTLFNSDGTPVRAKVTLDLTEFTFVGKQIKGAALSSPDRRKLFVVKEGEKIWHLAYKAYGDPAQWRAIADANNLFNPMEIEAGTELVIPVLRENDRR